MPWPCHSTSLALREPRLRDEREQIDGQTACSCVLPIVNHEVRAPTRNNLTTSFSHVQGSLEAAAWKMGRETLGAAILLLSASNVLSFAPLHSCVRVPSRAGGIAVPDTWRGQMGLCSLAPRATRTAASIQLSGCARGSEVHGHMPLYRRAMVGGLGLALVYPLRTLAAEDEILARLTSPEVTQLIADLSSNEDIAYPDWMEGTWDVTAQLTAFTAPLGNQFLGGSSPAINDKSAAEAAACARTTYELSNLARRCRRVCVQQTPESKPAACPVLSVLTHILVSHSTQYGSRGKVSCRNEG